MFIIITFSIYYFFAVFIYTKVVQCGLAALRLGESGPPAADCAKPTISLGLSVKPTFWASWRPRRPQDGPPGAQDSLPTGLLAPKTASRRASWRARRLPTGLLAPQTASGWASWRPRRPPDRPPGAQVGLWTGLLTPQTASDGPSPADKFTCRQAHLPTSQPWRQASLRRLHFSAAHAVLP